MQEAAYFQHKGISFKLGKQGKRILHWEVVRAWLVDNTPYPLVCAFINASLKFVLLIFKIYIYNSLYHVLHVRSTRGTQNSCSEFHFFGFKIMIALLYPVVCPNMETGGETQLLKQSIIVYRCDVYID